MYNDDALSAVYCIRWLTNEKNRTFVFTIYYIAFLPFVSSRCKNPDRTRLFFRNRKLKNRYQIYL